MTYSITINDNTAKAKSIINMLKALQKDLDFIEINEITDLKEDKTILAELDSRYLLYQRNKKGKK